MKQFLLTMTINIAGFSAYSCIAMDNYINYNNKKVITVSESQRNFQSFGNYEIYRNHSSKLGCSVLIHKQLNSYEVKITPREGVDCCFAAVSIEKRTILLGSKYVHLGTTENTESDTDGLVGAYTLCKNENKTRPIIFGDWNSRHRLRGDKLENKYGKLLADYCADNSLSIIRPHQPTFVSASKKGSSIIDFCITEQNCSDLVCNARKIEDIEFFSCAPEQAHSPVLFDIYVPVKNDNPQRCVLNYKFANWEEIGVQLETIMVENMDSMITEAPTKAQLTFMGLVRGVCEKSIPRKTLCKYSKPYWSNKVTHLSKKIERTTQKNKDSVTWKTKTMLKWLKSNSKRK